eukprot:COSAG01_NODE_4825_length_4712_cov_34.502927_2_plen_87_part_00
MPRIGQDIDNFEGGWTVHRRLGAAVHAGEGAMQAEEGSTPEETMQELAQLLHESKVHVGTSASPGKPEPDLSCLARTRRCVRRQSY